MDGCMGNWVSWWSECITVYNNSSMMDIFVDAVILLAIIGGWMVGWMGRQLDE